MLDAVEYEVSVLWTIERELLASILERLDSLIVTTVRLSGNKVSGKPVRVPRPPQDGDHTNGSSSDAKTVRFGDYVRMIH